MSANPQVQRIGDGFAFLLKLLRYCRVSVLVIVAGGALLFLTDQGNELTISLASSES